MSTEWSDTLATYNGMLTGSWGWWQRNQEPPFEDNNNPRDISLAVAAAAHLRENSLMALGIPKAGLRLNDLTLELFIG